MARGKVKVSITADADGVRRGAREAENSLERLDKRGSKALGGMKAAALGAGAAAGVGLVAGLTKATQAAIEAEKSQARLEAQLASMGTSYDRHASEIDKVIQKTSQLAALDDEDLQDSFTNIVRATKDVDKSLRLVGLAADFARAKNMDVAKAGEIVGKVAGGNTGILGRYGIQLEKGATAQEALATLQKRFGGQAAAYGNTTAGAIDRAKVAFENLGEAIGARVAPAVGKGANALAELINGLSNGEGEGSRFAQVLRSAAQTTTTAWAGVKAFFRDIFGDVRGDLQGLGQSMRSLAGPVRETLNGIGRAFKDAFGGENGGIASSLRSIITKLIKFDAAVHRYIVIPILKRVLPGVRNAFEGLAKIIKGALEIIDGILSGDFGRMWDGVKNIFRGSLKTIGGLLRIASAPIRAAAAAIGNAVKAPLQRAWDATVTAAVGFVNAILGVLDKIPGVNTGRVDLPAGVEGRNNDRGNYFGSDGKFTNKRALGGKVTAPTVIMGEEAPRHPEWVIATNPAYRKRNVDLWMRAGRDLGMMQGGLGDTIVDAVSSTPAVQLAEAGISSAAGLVKQLPSNPFTGGLKGAGTFALSKAKAYIKKQLSLGGGGDLGGRNASGVDAFTPIARRYGLTMTSALRPGDDGWHGKNRARDYSNGPAPTPEMLAFAKYMARNFGGRLLELIHTPLGFGIKNGKRIASFGAAVDADHNDHVHVAFAQGGVRGGRYVSTAYGPPWDAMNGTGITKTGVNLKNAPKRYGIAVDPSMIALGSRVKVTPNPFGYSGPFTAFDTGGAIKGNRIDFYDWRGRQAQYGWGRRTVTVTPYGANRTSGSTTTAKTSAGRPAMKQGASFDPTEGSGVTGKSPNARYVGGLPPKVAKLVSGVTAGGTAGLMETPEGFDALSPLRAPDDIEEGRLTAALGLSGLTAGRGDDLAATIALRDRRGRQLAAAQASGDHGRVVELAGELRSLNDSITELTTAVRYEGAEQTAKALNAELVKAQVLTPADLKDDRQVVVDQLTNATNAFNTAVANNDTDAIIQWGGEVTGLRQQIEQLDQTLQQTTEVMQQQLDLTRQQLEDARNLANTASAQTDALKGWFLEFVAAGLGGRVGAGLGTPSYAGGLART